MDRRKRKRQVTCGTAGRLVSFPISRRCSLPEHFSERWSLALPLRGIIVPNGPGLRAAPVRQRRLLIGRTSSVFAIALASPQFRVGLLPFGLTPLTASNVASTKSFAPAR